MGEREMPAIDANAETGFPDGDFQMIPLNPFPSLKAAQLIAHGVVILEGDFGGQIYATSPATLVQCDEAAIHQLAVDLEAICWPENPEGGGKAYFERWPVGKKVDGGLGGGLVKVGELWVHPALRAMGLEPRIREVLVGRRETLEG
jgi:hypothetical protein